VATPCKVLLVDDEALFLQTMSKVLRARGYDVGAVGSGVEALEELRFHRYDVVVLDQRMPGMDGIATLARIRKAHRTLPVILLSGHAEVGTAVEAMDLGAVDYLLKPVVVEKLIERMDAALERKAILEEMNPQRPAR
jgi:two-component system OmpR family response regulator